MGRKAIAMLPQAQDAAITLGALVRARRRQLSMPAHELAARAAVSPRTVSLIERGDPNVSIGNALNVAATIGVPMFGSANREVTALIAEAARARVAKVQRVRRKTKELISDEDVKF